MSHNLIGHWVIDESDSLSVSVLGNVTLEFTEDGTLTYTIHGAESKEIILMRYQVEGDWIITDQPSAPRIERTKFSISDRGLLLLSFDGELSRFRRELDL